MRVLKNRKGYILAKVSEIMTLNERKKTLLDAIIKEHVRTAKAVASNLLVNKYKFGLSPATIRNEMMALENEGYLTHLHTSAGRIPTEKGYRFYIENFLKEEELAPRKKAVLKESSKKIKDANVAIKNLAKAVASLSQEAVLIGFAPQDVYYTGITNVFKQPEFAEINLIYNLSEVVDHLDEAVEEIFYRIGKDVQILIGRDNPFGRECSTILTKYHLPSKEEGLLGILGPMRMDYNSNQALIRYTKELISNL